MNEEKKHPIDELSPVQLFSEMIDFFGAQRTTEILGWSMIGALFIWADPAELRRTLEARGMSKAGLYRTLRDLRRFGEHLEQRELPARDTAVASYILRRLGTMQFAVS
jgi:hypothetical protein